MTSQPTDSIGGMHEYQFSPETSERLQGHLLRLQSLNLPTDIDGFMDAAMRWFANEMEQKPTLKNELIQFISESRADAFDRLAKISDLNIAADFSINRYLDYLATGSN